MVASSDLRWIQGEFRTLAELFNSVDLETKVGKTVRMVCRLFQAAGTQSETAYRQHITCAGPSYRERQRVWVQCAECGEEMALGLLAVHRQTQHGKTTGGRRHWETTPTGGEPRTYRLALPTYGGLRNCPVEGCLGRAMTRTTMRVHFFHQHVASGAPWLG